MKQLKRAMTFAVACLAILAASQVASAQGRDFAGSWNLDVEKSGTKDGPPLVVITQTAKEFTAQFGTDSSRAMAFNLDGTERVIKDRGTTKAVWKGDKLEATVKMASTSGETDRGPEAVTFSREGAWLVLEAKMEKGPTKFYFKKAAAK